MLPAEAGLAKTIFSRVKFVKDTKVGAGYVRVIEGAKDHEIDSATHIAQTLGARVLHRGNAKGPDLIINGDLWELKRLEGAGKWTLDNNIRSAIENWSKVNRTTNRIIIDCRDVGWDSAEIAARMALVSETRMQRVGALRFIAKDGQIYEWPF